MVSPKTQSHSSSCAVLFLKYYLGGKLGTGELQWLLATALTSKNILTQDLTTALTAKEGGFVIADKRKHGNVSAVMAIKPHFVYPLRINPSI